MWEQNGKDNTRKINSTTWGNKPESSGKRREIKEISTKGKTIQTKQEIQNNERNFYQNWEGMTQKYTNNQTPKTRTFLDENMATKKA